MSHNPDHPRIEPATQARAASATQELCGPVGTICGLAVLILLAALIPAWWHPASRTAQLGSCLTDATRGGRSRRAVRKAAATLEPERLR